MMNSLSPPTVSSVEASPTAWVPANRIEDQADDVTSGITPSNASSNEQKSPPAKRRKQDKERSRVSRACDRCKK
jgi:hypothetical protein